MSRPVVWITDHDFQDFSPEEDVLAASGITLRIAQCRTGEELVETCRDADGLLVQYARIDESALSVLPRCRAVVRYGVGFDSIDLAAATRHRVVVCNVPDFCSAEVADHAMSLMLALARRTMTLDRQVKTGVWDVYRDCSDIRRLAGQTLGLVGFGHIGRAVAARGRAFGLKLLVHDPYVPRSAVLAESAEPVSFEALLREADFVSIHAPFTKETLHLIDTPQLALMKPSAFLINTSRGGLVSEDALARALSARRLAGAGLDVLEKEPPDSHNPLMAMGNVILTPHAAFYSQEAQVALHTKAAESIAAVLAGQFPEFVLNREVLPLLPKLSAESAR